MTWLARSLLVALLLGGAGSCTNDSGPVAGIVIISLTTPNSGVDGAILFSVTGPGALTQVTPASGLRVFAQPLGTTTRFAVTGTLTNGAILTLGVPDVGRATQYVATVQDVAASDFQLRSRAGYSLTVSR
jgi:hypothetical protein